MKKRSNHSFEGIPLLRIFRFTFLFLIAAMLVIAYRLQTEGKLTEVITKMLFEKGFPFIQSHWYEIGVSVTLFLLGFWFGRFSTGKS